MVICDSFFENNSAGIQMRDLVGYFSNNGHKVTVITVTNETIDPIDPNIIVIPQVVKSKRYIFRLINEILYSLLGIAVLIFHRKFRCFDLIIWYSPSIFWGPLIGFVSFFNWRASRLLILRDIFPEWAVDLGIIKSSFVAFCLKLVANFQYLIAHKILIQSPGNKVYFKGNQRFLSKVEYFPNWLNSDFPVDLTVKELELLPEGRKIIIYSGSLGEAQGNNVVEVLIKICRNSHEYALVFVGSGRVYSNLREKYPQEENIKFIPKVTPGIVRALHSRSSFGLVLLDQAHKSQNIPGKFVSYLRDNLPVIISVNANNDLKKIVEQHGLGIDLDSCYIDNLSMKKFETILDLFLENFSTTTRCVDFFESEYSTRSAYDSLMLYHSKRHIKK